LPVQVSTATLATARPQAGYQMARRTPGSRIHPCRADAAGEHSSEAEQRWTGLGEWYEDPAEVARLALWSVAALPPWGPTGQVFSLVGRLL
jgi:hypothetical protein